MDYATQYHIGNTHPFRRKKAEPVEQATVRVRQIDDRDKGRTGNQKGQKKISSRSDAPNGFLKTTFLPKLKAVRPEQECRKTENLERDFYRSLERVSQHYGIQTLETGQFTFPYNISLSLWDVGQKLKNTVSSFDGLTLKTEDNNTFLLAEERCRTGATLFYIPVSPLFIMLKDKKRRKTAQLICSVCSYLYHVADIPYYRQEDSYLFWQYDMMSSWVEEDDENEDLKADKQAIHYAEWVGDAIEQKIYNRKALDSFAKKVEQFVAKDSFDMECHAMARQFLQLYHQYPEESIFRNTESYKGVKTWMYERDCIPMDKYVSFWADSNGWLSSSISECINNEFNEYCEVEEPTICKCFDGSVVESHSLDFEIRIFDLIDELIYLLNNYKNNQYGNSI